MFWSAVVTDVRPVKPRRTSQLVLAAGIVALSLVALVPHALQAWQKDVAGWDQRLSEAIHAYENEETLLDDVDPFWFVLHPVTQALELLLVLAIAVVVMRRGDRRLAWLLYLAVAGALLLTPVFKELFERPPVDPSPRGSDSSFELPGAGYSFPSGHALRSMVAAAALLLAFWPTRWRWHVLAGGAVLAGLTGVGVVYHEWHWVSDVLGGWCLALAWVSSLWLVLRPVGGRRVREPASA